MGRLKLLPTSTLGRAPAGLERQDRTEAGRSRWRDATQPWRKLYKTKRWQRLRWSVLTRDGFQCAMCGVVEADASRLVCDHVERHHGDPERFWAGPFQTLCKPCHDGAKQRQEKGGRGRSLEG